MSHTKSPLHPIKSYTAKKKQAFLFYYFTIIEFTSSHLSILKSFWFTFVWGFQKFLYTPRPKKEKPRIDFYITRLKFLSEFSATKHKQGNMNFGHWMEEKTNTNLLDGRKLAVYLLGFGSVLSKSSQGLGLPFSISRFTNGFSKAHSFHLHCASPTSNIKELLKSQRRMASNDITVLVVL